MHPVVLTSRYDLAILFDDLIIIILNEKIEKDPASVVS
jgi:hypothetical protein